MSTGRRLAVLAGVVVAAIAVLVIARGGSDDTTTTTNTAATTSTGATTTKTAPKPSIPVHRITVKNAKPVGGIEQIKVNKGDQIRLVIKSDTADEIHIHGYDLHKDVEAGGSARFAFKATSDGNYEIELEGRKEQIAQLTVEP